MESYRRQLELAQENINTRGAFNPTLQFAVVSLAIMLLLGAGLAWFLAGQIRQQMIDTFAELAGSEVATLIQPQIVAADLQGPMSEARRDQLFDFITSVNLHVHYDRIKVFNRAGEIVFSDEFELIGEIYPFSGDLAKSIQNGIVHAHLSDPGEAENESEASMGRLIEVYVPLIPSDSQQIAGAYEVYIPYEDIAAAIREQQRWVWGGVGAALLLLWIAMLWIFQRASNTIDEQHKLAMIDPLTNISNRRYLLQNLELEVERYKRYRRSFSFIISDLDHFKEFNDNFGHQAGDRALRQVAEQMIENTRGADIVSRYGGEEFAILLPETSLGLAAWVAERVREAVKQITIEGRALSISMGVATYQGGDSQDLIRRADEALYRAKNKGRDRVEVSDIEIKQPASQPDGDQAF